MSVGVKRLLNPIQDDGQEWKIAIRPHRFPLTGRLRHSRYSSRARLLRRPLLDRKSTRLNSSPANISTLPLHDALPIWQEWKIAIRPHRFPLTGRLRHSRYSSRARLLRLPLLGRLLGSPFFPGGLLGSFGPLLRPPTP